MRELLHGYTIGVTRSVFVSPVYIEQLTMVKSHRSVTYTKTTKLTFPPIGQLNPAIKSIADVI